MGDTIRIRMEKASCLPLSLVVQRRYRTGHFGFIYHGDLIGFCNEIREKGVIFAVEPWEFLPGSVICYVSAPDGVSIELIQAKRANLQSDM